MTDQNPFEVLGLAPEALRGRGEQKIRRLVQIFGRALLQLEHPDAGGDEERFKSVSAAIDQLGDEAKFREFKASFLEPRKTKNDRLSTELQAANAVARKAQMQRQAYQQAVAGILGRPNVLDLLGFRLTLHQTLEYERAGGARYINSRVKGEKFFLTLNFKPDGTVVQEREGQETPIQRLPLGCIPKESLQGKILPLIQSCQPLTGSALQITGKAGKPQIGSSTVLWNHAEPILSRLIPTVRPDSYFFSVLNTGEEAKLYFEGNLFRVEPINP